MKIKMDLIGLEKTLKEVIELEGVKQITSLNIPENQPYVESGKRLLAVQNQLVRARVMDVTNPDWYQAAYESHMSGVVASTPLLEVDEDRVDEVLLTFGRNEKIYFEFPDKTFVRSERN